MRATSVWTKGRTASMRSRVRGSFHIGLQAHIFPTTDYKSFVSVNRQLNMGYQTSRHLIVVQLARVILYSFSETTCTHR